MAQLRRGGLAKRFAATIQRRPALFVGMAFYWFWTNLTFQMPIVSRQVTIYGIAMTSHALLLACNVLSYAVMIALFAWRRIEPKGAVGLWGTCISMSAGTLFLALWFWRTADLLGGAGPVDLVGQDTTATLFIVLGAALAGAGSAALCVEMQRVYGSLESDVILFHGVGSYAVSLLAVLVIGLLPLPAMLAAWVLSPLPAARCLLAEHGRLTHRELYARGEGAQLKLPRKLLVTSLLHGLSLGVLAGLPAMRGDASAVVLCVGASYLISSALAIVAAFGLRMNFNSLIYQTAFPIIAFGLYVMYAVGPDSVVGLSVDLVGFSYLHLVMWCVCSYLIKRFDMPSMWVTGTSTCFFMGGQLVGNLCSCTAAAALPETGEIDLLVVTTMLVMLTASLFMISNQNMRTGWGIAHVDNALMREETSFDVALAELAVQSALTEREAAVLRLLGRGHNRAAIAEELSVSRETVKTHVAGIYRKVHAHSQQEVIAIVEERARQLESDGRDDVG